MERWKKIALCISALLIGAYALFCLCYFSDKRLNPECKQFVIKFSDSNVRAFVDATEMEQFIRRNGILPEGETVSPRRCKLIEDQALLHPMIRTACCYMSPDGVMHLTLSQRVPVLRVLGGDNYFVDSDRRIMRPRTTTASYVPVVTGRVSQHFAQNELFDFVLWLKRDSFWSAQITQINIVGNDNIELVPRVGSGVIILGGLQDYDKKLRKLKTLYTEGFSKFGWKNYREIDLRFKGQIVCR